MCVWGGVFLCPVRKFFAFLVFFFAMWRERGNIMLIFVFDFEKEKLSEFERLGTLPSYNLFLFFFFRVYC